MQLGTDGSAHVQPGPHESLPHGSAPLKNPHVGAAEPSSTTQLMSTPEMQLTANPPSAPRHDSDGKQPLPACAVTWQLHVPAVQLHR